MTTELEISASYADGQTLDVLSDLISKRVQYIRGTMTKDAVTATAINILTSLRSRTKVPDKGAASSGFIIDPAPGVAAGFKGSPGRRVVRAIGGHEMTGSKIVNLCGNYKRGEKPLCFVVVFKSPSLENATKSTYDRYYIVAKSASDVRSWATKRLKSYLSQFGGMAKWALGQAQSRISAANEKTSPGERGRRRALEHISVESEGTGIAEGSYSIHVTDSLGHSVLALKGGSGDVSMSYKKAANRTAAIINRLAGLGLRDRIETPFPEVKGAK